MLEGKGIWRPCVDMEVRSSWRATISISDIDCGRGWTTFSHSLWGRRSSGEGDALSQDLDWKAYASPAASVGISGWPFMEEGHCYVFTPEH